MNRNLADLELRVIEGKVAEPPTHVNNNFRSVPLYIPLEVVNQTQSQGVEGIIVVEYHGPPLPILLHDKIRVTTSHKSLLKRDESTGWNVLTYPMLIEALDERNNVRAYYFTGAE